MHIKTMYSELNVRLDAELGVYLGIKLDDWPRDDRNPSLPVG